MSMVIEKPPLDEALLSHFGVKGMHWGVHKNTNNIGTPFQNKGITVSKDGSVVLAKGAQIQRLVGKESRPLKDIAYASINDYDNAKYIKAMGGRNSTFSRNQILSIQVTRQIKAPSISESTKIVSDLFLKDAQFRENNKTLFGNKITDKELARIKADPTGKLATHWYMETNTKLAFESENDPKIQYVQKAMKKAVEAKGYSALRDENDVAWGLSKTPMIILSPEKSLKITTVTQITKDLKKANKKKLRAYRRNGKAWVDQQIYQ